MPISLEHQLSFREEFGKHLVGFNLSFSHLVLLVQHLELVGTDFVNVLLNFQDFLSLEFS